jgi:Domain of unknown function (DUF4276)
MIIRIGIIAEDNSDIDVLKAIFPKVTPRTNYQIRKFVGYGCGKILSKCNDWARNLSIQKCSALILVHDLDFKVIDDLNRDLTKALSPCPIKKHIIIIPVHEIEAWLLADHEAIYKALNLRERMNKTPNPEAIFRPKEALAELIYRKSNKQKFYVNTLHNKLIASHTRINNLRRCQSFLPLETFLRSIKA